MRNDAQRLADVLAAAEAIADHLVRGSLTDGLVFDAVRVRLFAELVIPQVRAAN